jgi:hypothetical protein
MVEHFALTVVQFQVVRKSISILERLQRGDPYEKETKHTTSIAKRNDK